MYAGTGRVCQEKEDWPNEKPLLANREEHNSRLPLLNIMCPYVTGIRQLHMSAERTSTLPVTCESRTATSSTCIHKTPQVIDLSADGCVPSSVQTPYLFIRMRKSALQMTHHRWHKRVPGTGWSLQFKLCEQGVPLKPQDIHVQLCGPLYTAACLSHSSMP